ncbi:spinster family MFS transporter [Novosphingobium tardum]|uniref:Spinster family MFS transporter n=1 Tax=Novosphingobium tardum TaxID=1538021 RepID=A0ABV8RRU7_9SPHN
MRAPTTEPGTDGVYRWYVLGVLTLTSLFSVADRLVLSILLEDIKAEFVLTDGELGLLTGAAFSLLYITFGFPFARLADRATRRTIVAASLSVWSLMTMLCGAAVGFVSLFAARMGVGIGEAGSGPAGQSLLADYFRRDQLARAMGFLTLGATLGTAAGLVAGGMLAERFGWRMAFVLLGMPGILLGILIYTTIREPERGRYALGGAAEAVQRPLGETIRKLLRNRVYVGLVAGFSVQIMIGYAIAIWMAPIMLRGFGVSIGMVGLFLGLAFVVGGIPGPIIGGYLTDWLVKRDERWRAWLPGLASTACLIPLAMGLMAGGFGAFLALFAFSYGVFLLSQAPILSLLQTSLDASERAFGVAMALFFNNLVGQAFSAGLIGWLSDRWTPQFGPDALKAAVFAVCALGGLGSLAIFAWTAQQMKRAATVP